MLHVIYISMPHIYVTPELEIMVSIHTLSDHFGALFDPENFGSDRSRTG